MFTFTDVAAQCYAWVLICHNSRSVQYQLKHRFQGELKNARVAGRQAARAADVALNFSEGAAVKSRDGCASGLVHTA